MADRKRLIRAVIESVQVTADGATERVHATVTWADGHQTHADLRRPVARIDQLSYYPALTERIRALAGQGLDSTAIAGRQDTLPPYRWIITADPAEVERLRALHQLPAGYHNRRRWTDDGTPIDTPQDKEPGNHEGRDLRSSH
jgi:hypothetical protein